jgi:hypothetical protein
MKYVRIVFDGRGSAWREFAPEPLAVTLEV